MVPKVEKFTKLGSLVVLFGLLGLPSRVDSTCMTCSKTTYAACLNETAFYMCTDGETLSRQIGVCSSGQVCTGQQGVCKPKGTYDPECVSYCGKCFTLFACVSQTEFSYCDEKGVQGIIQPCPKGQVCSIETFQSTKVICAPSCLVSPSCQNTEIITEAPPVKDWKETCTAVTATGYYNNIYDSTCKTYVYCERLNGVMTAILYTCSAGCFDKTTQKCITTKPCDCQNSEIVTEAPPLEPWMETCTSVTATGYYKNIVDSTCKTYIYCERVNGVMTAVLYRCPAGYFDRLTQDCIATKPSECEDTEIIPEPPVEPWMETCTSVTATGYYNNIYDSTCKTYVYCEKLDGVMTAMQYTCATGYFDRLTQDCITTKPSECEDTEIIPEPPVEPWMETCTAVTAAGYYKNIVDSSCKTYVYCEKLDGVMTAILYTCSTGYFNRPTQKCIATIPCDCVTTI